MQLILVVNFLKVIICKFLGIHLQVVHGLFRNVRFLTWIKFMHRSVFLGLLVTVGQRWHSYNVLFLPMIHIKMVGGVDEILLEHLGQLLLSLICFFLIVVDLLVEGIKFLFIDVPAIFCFHQSLIRLNPHSRIQLSSFWFGYRWSFSWINC